MGGALRGLGDTCSPAVGRVRLGWRRASVFQSSAIKTIYRQEAAISRTIEAITTETKLGLGSPLEDLGLSMRTRNTLRGIGCGTVADLLRLDLSRGVRGLGRKTRDELLGTLRLAGFHHPALDRRAPPEIEGLDRSLEKLEHRIETTLGAAAKEIRVMRQRLRKMELENPQPNGRATSSRGGPDRTL
jgi:hypothetical protein